MSKIRLLARTRELAILSELGRLGAEAEAVRDGIRDLKRTPQDIRPDENLVLARWQKWRDRELARQNAQLAGILARRDVVARSAGRFIAEHAVAEGLLQAARHRRQARIEKREAETVILNSESPGAPTSPGERYR